MISKASIACILLLSTLIFAGMQASQARPDTKKGQRLFNALNCQLCHTNGGNNQNPDRPIKGAGFAKRFPDDKLLGEAIRKGFPDKGMPPFGKDQISDPELADIIGYIRTLTPKDKKSS